MSGLIRKVLSDKMLLVTWAVVFLLAIFQHPKIADIDVQSILSLFNLLLIVQLMARKNYLDFFAFQLAHNTSTARKLVRKFVLLSFFSAMIVTNDIAILTLVPIFLLVVKQYQLKKIYSTTLITIAANLGSAVTPFGNPQNLFLYNHYQLTLGTFFQHSLMVGGLSLGLLLLASLGGQQVVFGAACEVKKVAIDRTHLVGFVLVLVITLLGILTIIPIWFGILATVIFVLYDDFQVLSTIDYSLIFVFVGFFLAVSSLSQIECLTELIGKVVQQPTKLYLAAIGVSQVISNVPAAVLLATYTNDFLPVFLGVNVGGLGTLVASLANLLAVKQYSQQTNGEKLGRFIGIFSVVNFLFLGILGTLTFFLLK